MVNVWKMCCVCPNKWVSYYMVVAMAYMLAFQNYGAFLEKDGAGFKGQMKLSGMKDGDIDISKLRWIYQVSSKKQLSLCLFLLLLLFDPSRELKWYIWLTSMIIWLSLKWCYPCLKEAEMYFINIETIGNVTKCDPERLH